MLMINGWEDPGVIRRRKCHLFRVLFSGAATTPTCGGGANVSATDAARPKVGVAFTPEPPSWACKKCWKVAALEAKTGAVAGPRDAGRASARVKPTAPSAPGQAERDALAARAPAAKPAPKPVALTLTPTQIYLLANALRRFDQALPVNRDVVGDLTLRNVPRNLFSWMQEHKARGVGELADDIQAVLREHFPRVEVSTTTALEQLGDSEAEDVDAHEAFVSDLREKVKAAVALSEAATTAYRDSDSDDPQAAAKEQAYEEALDVARKLETELEDAEVARDNAVATLDECVDHFVHSQSPSDMWSARLTDPSLYDAIEEAFRCIDCVKHQALQAKKPVLIQLLPGRRSAMSAPEDGENLG